MLANTTRPSAGKEPIYGRPVFQAILDGLGPDNSAKAVYVCTDDGARLKDPTVDGDLAWHPLCEIMAPGSPDPLEEPWLPFPFTARQLAAVLCDGWGYFISHSYGSWEDGPTPELTASIGPLGGKAREALMAAFAAYRHAVEMAPRLDRRLDICARELQQQYTAAREAAMAREKLREHRHSDAEYTARLARVEEAVADLRQRMKEASGVASLAYSDWRRAVVQHLLLPIEDVPRESFYCHTLRNVPPDRRAEALHQIQRQQAYQDSDEGKAHWDLMSQRQRIEGELRRWQLMQPQNVTEAVLHEGKLKELTAELTAVSERMRSLETPPITTAPSDRDHAPLEHARLATRDELCSAFGSFGLKRTWFDDLKSRQWLLEARKVRGQGQRGRRREPLFCPFEVMTGLVEKSRKSRLSTDTGWRILEHRFPAAYVANSVGDPREPPG